jgi:hypothetical protein
MGNMTSVVHEKRCTKCGETKTLDAFWKHRKGLHGRRSVCKDCCGDVNRAYRQRCSGSSAPIPESKLCKLCKLRKPSSEFSHSVERPTGLRSYCKPCAAKKTCLFRSHLRAEIGILKESVPCADCGLHYPYWMMQFDHLDKEKKSFMISSLRNRRDLLTEVGKCEIVCSGCHANRTYWRLKGDPIQVHTGSISSFMYAKEWMRSLSDKV